DASRRRQALELSTMRALRELYLNGSKLTDEGAKARLGFLLHGKSEAGPLPGFRQALAEHCKGHGALEELLLRRNQIGDVGAQALAEAVPTMTALRILYLESNKIQANGQEAFG
ncbi:NLRC3, partial [Symbiodinium pilosum]